MRLTHDGGLCARRHSHLSGIWLAGNLSRHPGRQNAWLRRAVDQPEAALIAYLLQLRGRIDRLRRRAQARDASGAGHASGLSGCLGDEPPPRCRGTRNAGWIGEIGPKTGKPRAHIGRKPRTRRLGTYSRKATTARQIGTQTRHCAYSWRLCCRQATTGRDVGAYR